MRQLTKGPGGCVNTPGLWPNLDKRSNVQQLNAASRAKARARLLSKLDVSGGPDACWPFTGAKKPGGYGNFYLFGKTVGAHVAAFRLFVDDEIPTGIEVDHLCHERASCAGGDTCPHRPCCNWGHLSPATHRDNDLRGCGVSAINIIKTHCIAGHEYTEENTYRAPGSPQDRHCRKCMANRVGR